MAAGDVTIGGALGAKTVNLTEDRDDLQFWTQPAVNVIGKWSLDTLTSGVNYGAAGAGTTATSLVKPGAAANWTANDMVGSFLKITSGTASGEIRPIIDNSTTTVTIHSATGLAAADTFEIVVPAHRIENLDIRRIKHSITVRDAAIGKVTSRRNAYVNFINCLFDTASSSGSIDSNEDSYINVSDCAFVSNASVDISMARYAGVTNVVLRDGWCHAETTNDVLIGIYAEACGTTALHLEGCLRSAVGIEAQTCTATPCHMESCNYVEPNGVGFIGTNAGAPYGILMERAGYYDLTSGTLAGAADLRIEGSTVTWADLGSFKSIVKKGVVAMTTA